MEKMKISNLLAATAFALICVILPASACNNVSPLPNTLPMKRDIFTVINRLNQIEAAGRLALKPAGTIRYSQFETTLWALNFAPAGKVRKVVLLTAGMNGNEPASTEMLLELAESISGEPEKYEGCYFDIFPLVNPWAWVFDVHHNQEGIDVGYDFASFASREANFIRQYTRGKKYDIVIDFHEDQTAQGFYLYQYASDNTTVGMEVIEAVMSGNNPIENTVKMLNLKAEGGILDIPQWCLWYMQATRQLSCPAHLRLENGSQAFTIVTPKSLPFEDRVKMKQVALRTILDYAVAVGMNQ